MCRSYRLAVVALRRDFGLQDGEVLLVELQREDQVGGAFRAYAEAAPLPESSTTSVATTAGSPVKAVPAAANPEADLQIALERFAEAASPDLGRLMVLAEKVLITWSLNQERGVKLRAAKALGINRVTLDRKLAEYDLNVQRGRGVIEVA